MVGSAHLHSVFAIKLNGTALDFSKPEFQAGWGWIYSASGKVLFGEFLKSINMGMEGGCFFLNNAIQNGS